MVTLTELSTGRSAALLFECIAGSRAYDTATADSDQDIRGIFAVPAQQYLELNRPADQVQDERGNTVYYSLRRTIELLGQANPNMLELLYMPADCVRLMTPEMQLLQLQRQLFISKQCADTHAGYAMSQIKRARGQNKWVNNPKPQAAPLKEDYCYIIPWHTIQQAAPARPVPLREIGWPLHEYHAARLSFEEIMSIAHDILAECAQLKATVDLPEVCAIDQASHLLATLTQHWQERSARSQP